MAIVGRAKYTCVRAKFRVDATRRERRKLETTDKAWDFDLSPVRIVPIYRDSNDVMKLLFARKMAAVFQKSHAHHAHKEIYCFQSLNSVHPGLSAGKRQEEASVAILEVEIFISLDFACINRRCSYDFCGQILRYVKNKRYFVAFTHFLLSWFHFLLVLVLLKLHRAKFHECKQRRFYVRCL